ncbi:nuclear transport factor 2 family protein [uncultured Nocardioides sp.]|uniref:SnoaL-like domain-containing protein n=1 Tax=uncultured Nocardioides sp. TaxID=198441 RepID=A0A6J4PDN1_9ACTN|nr:nuclear transport factor 2 family protein [uncultured Nocardioides sp.]CAA9413444.1 MAG: hypothetical protein AVDCRST_MAG06-3021 [uncultured Nocardioides sp.]
MTGTDRADGFASALQQLEGGDEDALLAQFADSVTLFRPEVKHQEGESDPQAFWKAYRDQFSDISTEFTHVAEAGDIAMLEWESTGTLTTDRPISYRGVSLLTFDDDGKVSRFATYYDTAAFTNPD